MKKLLNLKSALMVLAFVCFGQPAFSQARVMLLPTLHGLHKSNMQYNYDSLRNMIGRLNPDVIAVEMRAEDVDADTSYLKMNYPFEMWMMRSWFPSATIEGFDWLGSDIEGKAIPGDYWKNISHVKKLERQLGADSIYSKKLETCDQYVKLRMEILKTSSLKTILASKDAMFTRRYYECIEEQLKGSSYEGLTRFYDQRNQNMMERISGIIKKHEGRTIVILTGDDHYPYLLVHLRKLNIVLLHP